MFRKLLSFDEARRVIDRYYKPTPSGTEESGLLDSHNRVLARDIIAPVDIPPFTRSTVDGYAVKAQDTFGSEEGRPVQLTLKGFVAIGEKPKVAVGPGLCAEIVTGAPLPKGADAVVMKEYARSENNDIYVYRAAARGENVMKAGADMRRGETVLKRGVVLGSREIGVLAAVGCANVEIYTAPRVAILSTGEEIAEPGRELSMGKIYDINAHALSAAVVEAGGRPVYVGVFPDERKILEQVVKRSLSSADVVVTSGGVSIGPKDIVPKILDSLGQPGLIVSGIAVKPGKPTSVAVLDGKAVFSLPGHPTSALLMFYLLVQPAIHALAGKQKERGLEVTAVAGMRMFSAKGRRTFVMVQFKPDKRGLMIAKPLATEASGAITTLARADGFVEIGEDVQFVDSGQEVRVRLFSSLHSTRFLKCFV